ncbi:PAS domain S-box-containing protein [Singulisphaera sp. GP187]|uniref:PAS domain S-box protein n=1 Tax=Singulisphaera sp. GP187 TaxID=1882752 RepID=UPI00092B309D|nr:PAS domain S-box protein [Singulisphaera sp. GP187]SIN68035.1 PAS domain S-box-containing protein [Singulisphaera sp. GP187]
MLSPARTPVLRYGGAALAVLLATLIRLGSDPLFGGQYPLSTFFAALVFSSWYGGFGPSLLALALSSLAIPYFILPPYGSFALESNEAEVRFGAFLIAGLVITVMGGTIRASRRRLERAAEVDHERQRQLEREVIERRGAETALRVEKERLRVTLASIGDAVIVTDAEGRATFLNQVAEALTGWSACEASGQPLEAVFRVVNQETGTPVESPALRALREETTVALAAHTILVARDGNTRPIDDSAAPIRDESGQIVGVVLVFRDVTERRRAEEARSHLAAIVESSDDAIIGTTLDGTITSWNLGAERIYGYSADALLGKSAALLIPADRLGEFLAALNRIQEGGNPDDFESKRRRNDGTLIDVSVKISPIRNGLETVVGASTVERDITRKKRIELDLQESEERFSRFMQHVPGLAWIKDLEGRYLYANEAALKAFQTPRSTLYGKVDEDVFPPETAALYRKNDRKALAAERGIQVVETLMQDDGIVHHSLVSKFPVWGQNGKVTLIGGIAIDITERMRMEESLRESDLRKDEFLATLAHELRNPLAPIRNALHLMKPPNRDDIDAERERAMAERQVTHLARLVDDLMDISRINRGKIELRKEVVELATILGRAAEAVKSSLEERGHTLCVSLADGDGSIHLEADPTRLEQVFGNLLNNAIKYTQPGGRITLVVEHDSKQKQVVVRVRDTGIGIEPDMLPRIFGMFVQAGHHTGHSHGGLGIGLSLVKTLVELHGGTIQATSQGPGTGSEFVIHLPILPGVPASSGPRNGLANPPRPNPDAGTEARPKRQRILVVDDNLDAANSLARLLRRLHNQEVNVAHDGPSALEAAELFRPELVLLDIGMPGMDGYEVARALRERPASATIRIIALTGWGQESDRQRSKEAGFDHHLVKPVDPDLLSDILRNSEVTSTARP